MDTIFAQATASGKAGVAVVRISGPSAVSGARQVCGPLPDPHLARLRTLRDMSGAPLDRALVIHFPEGRSFTGEDVVEFHLHGSVAVVRAVLERLSALGGFRAAGPGEFTRRALENDRLDLSQVEALGDLIDAETEVQRKQAQRGLDGALANLVAGWRRDLVEAAALVEATLDFADEEVPTDVGPDVRSRLAGVRQNLVDEIDRAGRAERLRDGFEIALVGAPNAGKSTLLNAIARRQVALTSEIAGTTRDVVELRVDLDGLPVTFLDTAGLRRTDDPVERAGIALTEDRVARADLVVALSESGCWPEVDADLRVRTKVDLSGGAGVSGQTGEGVQELLMDIAQRLSDRVPQMPAATSARHRAAMNAALAEIDMAENGVAADLEGAVIALHIRQASERLMELVGRVDVEDLLDIVFSRFCIGK